MLNIIGNALNLKINKLIDGIRNSDQPSAIELLSLFGNLIYKISHTIYERYNRLLPFDEILKECSQLLLYLAAVEYKKENEEGFKAHFPAFLKKTLHARLVQACRPSITYRNKAQVLTETLPQNTLPSDNIEQVEMRRLMDKINNFMWKKFNDREMDIVINHIILGHPRADMARKYGVSMERMQNIHTRLLVKLKRFLHKQKINSIDEI